MDAFERKLENNNILLRRDVDTSSTLLEGTPRLGGSAFAPDDIFAGRPAVYPPPNPTVRQLTHEWIHALDYIKNPKTYLDRPGGNIIREQIVYDRMIKPGVWRQLTPAEQARTIRVIEGYGGDSRGMRPQSAANREGDAQ